MIGRRLEEDCHKKVKKSQKLGPGVRQSHHHKNQFFEYLDLWLGILLRSVKITLVGKFVTRTIKGH